MRRTSYNDRMSFPRGFLRFRLRTLLILVFVISIPLAGFAWRRERARRQAAAVAIIESLGGSVNYEQQSDAGEVLVIVNDEPPLADWQRRWFGKDFFYDVVEVSQSTGSPYIIGLPMDGPVFSEAEMRVEPAEAEAFWLAAAQFPRLRELYVYGEWSQPTQVRAVLGNFVELRLLYLYDAGLSDDDLQGLSRLRQLESAKLDGNRLGDKTAERLARCDKLRSLDLSYSKLTEEGLRHLSACRELEWLALDGCNITDSGAAHLAGLTRLEHLKLGGAKITDAGVAHLAGLSRLQFLNLGGTQVTDAGLSHLSGLVQLQSLDLDDTQVSAAGLAHLKGLPLRP
jgi:hypothetical protein